MAGEAALVVELPYDADVRSDPDLPNRVWSVDLASATARPGPELQGVSSAWLLTSTDGSLAALRLGPSGDAMTIDAAGTGQRVSGVLATPDGAHLLISLRSDRGGSSRPGPDDTVLLARRDGTGEPLVLYQGVVLVSLGLGDG